MDSVIAISVLFQHRNFSRELTLHENVAIRNAILSQCCDDSIMVVCKILRCARLAFIVFSIPIICAVRKHETDFFCRKSANQITTNLLNRAYQCGSIKFAVVFIDAQSANRHTVEKVIDASRNQNIVGILVKRRNTVRNPMPVLSAGCSRSGCKSSATNSIVLHSHAVLISYQFGKTTKKSLPICD